MFRPVLTIVALLAFGASDAFAGCGSGGLFSRMKERRAVRVSTSSCGQSSAATGCSSATATGCSTAALGKDSVVEVGGVKYTLSPLVTVPKK